MIFYIISPIYAKLSHVDLAMSYCDKCIEILEKLLTRDGSVTNKTNLFMAFTNKGTYCSSMGSHDKAVEIFCRSINMGEQILSESELFDGSTLATAYGNRGVAYEYLKQHENALSDKHKSIEIMEQLREDGRLDDENHLARAYMNRGCTYESMTMLDNALADYNKSIGIWEQMKDAGKVIAENGFAQARANIGIALSKKAIEENKEQLTKVGMAGYSINMAETILKSRKKKE
jgi:tetratricopeptide (TPR) repeat protein